MMQSLLSNVASWLLSVGLKLVFTTLVVTSRRPKGRRLSPAIMRTIGLDKTPHLQRAEPARVRPVGPSR
jgi:hypothetical protein